MPESRFKTFWNIVVVALLFYTATVVPYRVAFVEITTRSWFWFELSLDGLFILDIFINFFSAYELEEGKIEKRH